MNPDPTLADILTTRFVGNPLVIQVSKDIECHWQIPMKKGRLNSEGKSLMTPQSYMGLKRTNR
jgi:hypothetical protein